MQMEVRDQLEHINSSYDKWEEDLNALDTKLDYIISKLQSPALMKQQFDYLSKKYIEIKQKFDDIHDDDDSEGLSVEKSSDEITNLLNDMRNLIDEMRTLTEIGTDKYIHKLNEMYTKISSYN